MQYTRSQQERCLTTSVAEGSYELVRHYGPTTGYWTLTDTSSGAEINLDFGTTPAAQADGRTLLISDRDIYVWRQGSGCVEPIRHARLPENRSYNIHEGALGELVPEYRYEAGSLVITVYDLSRLLDPENPSAGFAVSGTRTLKVP